MRSILLKLNMHRVLGPRIAFLIAPPLVFCFYLLQPITITPSLGEIFIPTAATSSMISPITRETLERMGSIIDDAGIKNNLIKYDTSIESRIGGFIGANEIILGYVFCNRGGEKTTWLYGDNKTISINNDISATVNALENMSCTVRVISPRVFELPPKATLTITTYLIIRSIPTLPSYLLGFVASLVIWIGFLALLKEGLHFTRKGFRKYFWGGCGS